MLAMGFIGGDLSSVNHGGDLTLTQGSRAGAIGESAWHDEASPSTPFRHRQRLHQLMNRLVGRVEVFV